MNFMARRQGFYEFEEEEQLIGGRGKLPSYQYSSSPSPSPSSSSISQHKGLLTPTFHHHQQHLHQRDWLENKFDPIQEERCYKGGAVQQLELMGNNDGGTGTGTGGDGDDVDVVVRRRADALGGASMVVEREHMFDKVVTPSDVGKLNRLVIPKQYAEKYFPLDSSTNDKGLLLNFEDRNGKPWRFRYSYWNSSQSYVMTKGWSRFVKEKKLDAGDTVSFQRGVGELGKDRLFIDWRRRPDAHDQLSPSLPHHFSFHPAWNPLFLQQSVTAQPRDHSHMLPPNLQSHPNSYGGNGPYNYNNSQVVNPCSGSVIYLRSPQQVGVGMMPVQRGGGVGIDEPVVFESVPVVHGKAAAKRLRLFGVNMDCPISESDECDILSSTTIPHNATIVPHHPPHLSSSSSIPYLQLRPYNGTPLRPMPSSDMLNKGKTSMSLDFDI